MITEEWSLTVTVLEQVFTEVYRYTGIFTNYEKSQKNLKNHTYWVLLIVGGGNSGQRKSHSSLELHKIVKMTRAKLNTTAMAHVTWPSIWAKVYGIHKGGVHSSYGTEEHPSHLSPQSVSWLFNDIWNIISSVLCHQG